MGRLPSIASSIFVNRPAYRVLFEDACFLASERNPTETRWLGFLLCGIGITPTFELSADSRVVTRLGGHHHSVVPCDGQRTNIVRDATNDDRKQCACDVQPT